MSLLEPLARWAVETESSDVSETAIVATKKMVLDTIAVSIAASDAPGIPETLTQMKQWGGVPEAPVLGTGDLLPVPNAAFVNSAMAHALDFDDIHIPTSLHIMSMVWPACYAAGYARGKNGRDTLDALVLGVEVACRLGLAYNKRRRGIGGAGFLPTSVVGGFGVAAGVSRLFGLTTEQTVHAMGLNYCQSAGNRQALHDMSLGKRLQPAFATRSAIWAASLAERGVTGPVSALDGRHGLFQLYLNADPPEEDELTRCRPFFEIERDSVKRFSSCGAAHPHTEAALAISQQYDLRAEDVDRVELYWGEGHTNDLVANPFSLEGKAQVNAQFSAQYAVALALVRRDASIKRMTEEAIRADTEVAGFCRRVHYITHLEDPPKPVEIPEDWAEHRKAPKVLIVYTKDGRVLRHETSDVDAHHPDRFTVETVRVSLKTVWRLEQLLVAPKQKRSEKPSTDSTTRARSRR